MIDSTVNASIAELIDEVKRSWKCSNSSALDVGLANFAHLTSNLDVTGRLSLRDDHLLELLSQCYALLSSTTISATSRSRLYHVLFNLAFHNASIRKYLAGEGLKIGGAVFECLKVSLNEQLGPQNLIDILRLLQILTYERNIVLGLWTNNFISFLLSEIICDDEPIWLPYCMSILCNLTVRSKSACQRIRQSTSYKIFSRKLVKLLAHDSRTVVISSLVLVSHLEEKLRDTVYCTKHISQTFQCIFNVLILGDEYDITRHIAADLMKAVIVNDHSNASLIKVVNPICKDLSSFAYYERSIQQMASLLLNLDARTEESLKIYDTLLFLCSLPEFRKKTSSAILKCPVSGDRLRSPIHTMYIAANLSFHDAINPQVPLIAIRLLIVLFKESVENDARVKEIIPEEHILQLIENNLKTAIATSSEQVSFQCRRVTEGLRLAETILNDDEIKAEILNVVSAPLCSHIIESQMISNPVVLCADRSSYPSNDLSEWCLDGVGIVLQLLRVLASLKDYSKSHKDLYWKALKEERLVPCLAYAIVCGGHKLTYDALLIYPHCSQLHNFPIQWSFGESDKVIAYDKRSINERRSNNSCDDAPSKFNNLFAKIEEYSELKNSCVVRLLKEIEKEMQTMKVREQELENIIMKKEDLLMQKERLLVLYNRRERENDNNDLKDVLAKYEKKIEDANSLITSICAEKKRAEEMVVSFKNSLDEKDKELTLINDQLSTLTQERNILLEENKSEREFSTQAKSRYDELKKKFEQASSALIDKDKECSQLMIELKLSKMNESVKENEIIDFKQAAGESERKLKEMSNKRDEEMERSQKMLKDQIEEIERLKGQLEKANKFKNRMMQMMDEI